MSITEMVSELLKNTWYTKRATGFEKLVQLQTEQVLLTYLLSSMVNDNNSFLVRGELKGLLKDLENFITAQARSGTDALYRGHLLYALDRIREPEKAKPTLHREMPPGAPIGCDF